MSKQTKIFEIFKRKPTKTVEEDVIKEKVRKTTANETDHDGEEEADILQEEAGPAPSSGNNNNNNNNNNNKGNNNIPRNLLNTFIYNRTNCYLILMFIKV